METKSIFNLSRRRAAHLHEASDCEEVTEVALDSLSATPHLLIKTSFNTYFFAMTDVDHKCGWLIGGEFGEAGVAAMLLGAQGKAEYGTETYAPKLTKGVRAVFLLEREATRIITSVIKRLVQVKTTEGTL